MSDSPVDADKTYVGGKRSRMHAKRRKLIGGRGTAGKIMVAAVLDWTTNKVSVTAVPHIRTGTLVNILHERTIPTATLYNDELQSYNALPRDRSIVQPGARQCVEGDAHTSGFESSRATLKRSYKGTYYSWSAKHLNRYVADHAGRHNIRPVDTLEQMEETTQGMFGERLKYADLFG